MRKSLADRKLSVTKVDRQQRTIQICVDAAADRNVATAKAKYEELLGRPVSTSVIMRRAVDLLARYLDQPRGDDWEQVELATLVRSIR